MKKKKLALFQSVVSLLLCISMLAGTTFAWFTDSVTTGLNTIAAGNLDVELFHSNAAVSGEKVDASTDLFLDLNGDPILWEPGVVSYENLRVTNAGDLALAYQLAINTAGENYVVDDSGAQYGLTQILKVGVVEGGITATDRAGVVASVETSNWTTLDNFLRSGTLLPEGAGESEKTWGVVIYWEPGENDNYWNLNNGKTLSTGEALTIELGVSLLATQEQYESDAFGTDYDDTAKTDFFPEFTLSGTVSTTVTPNDQNQTASEVLMTKGQLSATVPAGVQLAENTTELTMSVTEMDTSGANITLGANETMRSLDVHIAGVAEENTVPMTITLAGAAPLGLNSGNLNLYHVEDGVSNAMTLVDSGTEFSAHNQFKYDPATGDIVLYMATFSEVALVADEENAWNGRTEVFSGGTGTENDPYIIANADQLAYMGDRVSNENADYGNAHYKLISDINIGGIENYNANGRKVLWYPIGYNKVGGTTTDKGNWYTYGGSFKGVFDGAGHTITGIYQNTWAMVGDYDGTYYNDAMGLFGFVNGGTVKNLTIDNFYSEGEFAPTGCVTAYAAGVATFENIAITNSHPQTYNTGVAGIVGWDSGDDSKYTFKNITVDSSNTISALWGSWDVAAAGLMGYLGETSTANLTNCHVSATIDVYNDVCGNYQYYWYRYCGMLIGTVDRSKEDGSLDLSNITATGCTVNFGDRHEYYYCEFVENTKASYTHDYQMSRVSNDNIVGSGDSAICQGHDHESAGKETVDGVEVLIEDKQAVYIPFYQLFGGYGWGVQGIDIAALANLDIDADKIAVTDSDNEKSVEKFKVADTADKSYTSGTTVTIGELFAAIEDTTIAIDEDNVQVTVSPADDTSTASANYIANTTDWMQGTIQFSGIGAAEIIITDYYFCKSTSLTVTIVEPADVDKFKASANFTGDFLYRVGNVNTVALGSLFDAVEGQEENIGNVTVSIEPLNNASVSGTYTANTTEWTQGTIQFSGTGPVKVTIDDDAYSNEFSMELEVVNATNVTDYSGLGNRSSVLLNDITMSSGSSYYLSSATLYGNGFTFDMSDGTYAAGGNTSSNYVFGLNNATIDNTRVVGAVYTQYGATVQSEYNRAAVLTTGNCSITNSHISNCASAVRIKDGTLTIDNSTIKGGNFANIDIRGGNVTLNDVTTINQVNGNDTAEDGTIVVGLGVVIYYENVLSTTTLDVTGTFTQYNHLSESQAKTYITDTTASTLVNEMFTDSYSGLQYTKDNEKWINTGIISMINTVGDANISDINGYSGMVASVSGVDGYVYTEKPDDTSIDAGSTETDSEQGAIPPEYSFDYTTKNYVAKTDGSNDYCYEENGVVYISMDAGDTFNWDTSILSVTKNGQTLDYTVSMNGTDYTGKSIAFNTAGEYEVVYTYTDDNNYSIPRAITTTSKTYTQTVKISVAVIAASAKNATFTMGSSNAATEKITIDNVTYVSATGVTADHSTWTYMTIGDQKIYYPIVAAKLTSTKGSSSYAYFPVFENVITITDYADNGTADAFTYNSSTTTLPSTLTAVKGVYKAASDVTSWSNLTNSNLTQSGASKIFKWASSSDAPSDPETYNNVLCYKSPQISADRVAYITLVQYSYTDATNTTYYYYVGYTLEAFTKQSTCVTPDTLITLADGTQKRIDEVTYEDRLLVWDFCEGKYTDAPAATLTNHGVGNYRILTLNFDDGTKVKVIAGHGFFHKDTNKFVIITESNVENYVGSEFVMQNGDDYSYTKLVSYDVETEYTESWSLMTSEYHNCIIEGVFSLTPTEVGYSPDYLMPFEMGDNMRYDEASMQADIEKYGLTTYEEVAEYFTYEQYVAIKLERTNIVIGKGYITFEEMLYLINLHENEFS